MAKQTDNTAIVPFLFEGNGLVRVVTRNGEPWFFATDVCRGLGVRNVSQALQSLDEDEKGICSTDTLGGIQGLLIVSEGAFYTLVIRSRAATTPGTAQHRFRKWVTAEVLPTIRKTGAYRPQRRQALSAEERAARAALAARQARVNEMQAATRTLQEIRLTQGVRAAAAAVPGLYAPFGINLDAVEPPQGALPLDDDSNGSMH